jgi:predicted nucleotidyltransferase
MDTVRDETVRRISMVMPELQRRGVIAAWLFGSVARGTATEASDVDVAVAFPDEARISLLNLGGIHTELAEALGREVDVVVRSDIAKRPEFDASFKRDAIRLL